LRSAIALAGVHDPFMFVAPFVLVALASRVVQELEYLMTRDVSRGGVFTDRTLRRRAHGGALRRGVREAFLLEGARAHLMAPPRASRS